MLLNVGRIQQGCAVVPGLSNLGSKKVSENEWYFPPRAKDTKIWTSWEVWEDFDII